MLKELYCMFFGHQYEEVCEKKLEDVYDCDNTVAGKVIVERLCLKCKHCGRKWEI